MGGGTARLIASILIAILLLATFYSTSYAIVDGGTSNFTSNDSTWTNGFVTFKVEDYKGSCCQKAVPSSSSGKAKMDSISSTGKYAKVIYYIVEKKDWYANKTDRHALLDKYDYPDRIKVGAIAEELLQICNMGTTNWKSQATSDGSPAAYCDDVIDIYDDIQSNVTVPSSLKITIYKGTPNDSSQTFVVWKITKGGKLLLKKVSGNTSITG